MTHTRLVASLAATALIAAGDEETAVLCLLRAAEAILAQRRPETRHRRDAASPASNPR